MQSQSHAGLRAPHGRKSSDTSWRWSDNIATVEGKRTIQDVISQMKDEGIVNTRVVLAAFILVAGDYANNDMAGSRSLLWAQYSLRLTL